MIKKIIYDIKNKSSYSVDFILKEDISSCLSCAGIYIRKIFAPVLRLGYRTQTKYKIKIIHREKLIHSKKGRIFAINHRQGDDIVIGANVVNRSAYFVFGNKYLALDTTNGWGLWAYGIILLDRNNKNSRNGTYNKMKYILEHGGNIIIYPEGYWNLDDNGEADECHSADSHNSENWLIQDFNIGIFRLAQEIGCEIVPTVLHYDEHRKNVCYGVRGKAISVDINDDIFEKKEQILCIMRTMYYDLMEKYSSYSREELECDGRTIYQQWEELKEDLVRACDIQRTGYHLDLKHEKKIGKAKVVNSVSTASEVFQFMHRLQPCKENAFLLKNKYKR